MSNGSVPEGSAVQKNFLAVVESQRALQGKVADLEQQNALMRGNIANLQLAVNQLQVLFATKTIDRDSGPTVRE